MAILINNIKASSYVDGPGRRSVLFMQGCPIHCKGCQNVALQDPRGGSVQDEFEVAKILTALSRDGNITISGGEPFAQPKALAILCHHLKDLGAKNIIVYTGFTWETLMNPLNGAFLWMKFITEIVDVIVDGRFEPSKDDDKVAWRGSRNQRVIDVASSISENKVVELDWDNTFTVTEDGDLVMPLGFAPEFFEVGLVETSRRCGQQ